MNMNEHAGIAAPLVLLPGLLCDARMFDAQVAAFPGATVIGDYYGDARTLEGMAAYALTRAPERFSLLGHSMGARVAFEVFRQAPDRVERLAIADTGSHGVRDGERENRYRLRDLGRTKGAAALVEAWLPGMVGASGSADGRLMERLAQMCTQAGVDVYDRQIEALLNRPSVDDLLPEIACPTLVVVGDEDRWSPVSQHEAIAAAIPAAKLRVIPSAGHMAPAEQPAAFNEVLAEWLGWPTNDIIKQVDNN